MSDDIETPAQPRTSRFKEHTNTASSIKPPPDELWKDIAIDDMIEKFNAENGAPAKQKSKSISPPIFGVPASSGPLITTSAESTTSGTTEGTLGRFSRAWASVFGGFGSVLGKRKAGSTDAEKEKERERQVLEERKQAADQAYQARKLAQEQGLLPTPKVFVRPTATPRAHKCVVEHTPLSASVPRTPTLYKSPSKKDLHKQKKLARRVSDLEHKLASARKELQTVLHKDIPPVPPLPNILPPTPTPETSQSQIFSDKENDISQDTNATSPAPSQKSAMGMGKITKKRKAIADIDDDDTNDKDYKPIPTDSEGDIDMTTSASEHESAQPSDPHSSQHRNIKRQKSTSSSKTTTKRKTARLTKRKSKGEMSTRREKSEEVVVRVVPDGKKVPPVPEVPSGVKGRKVRVREDGYGGLEHEMF